MLKTVSFCNGVPLHRLNPDPDWNQAYRLVCLYVVSYPNKKNYTPKIIKAGIKIAVGKSFNKVESYVCANSKEFLLW